MWAKFPEELKVDIYSIMVSSQKKKEFLELKMSINMLLM